MPAPSAKSYSRYAAEAVKLLGALVHNARVERGMTAAELAERAGVSRGLIHRIENGEMGSSIGAVFEVAAIVGVPLFEADPSALYREAAVARERRALLPKSVRADNTQVKDDF
jgi:transcriptional regulator with XRE-family HTH domain